MLGLGAGGGVSGASAGTIGDAWSTLDDDCERPSDANTMSGAGGDHVTPTNAATSTIAVAGARTRTHAPRTRAPRSTGCSRKWYDTAATASVTASRNPSNG